MISASPPVPAPDALSLLQVSGPDAATFLQAQCTSDIAGLADGRWTWAGYCSAKGRLHAVFRAGRLGASYWLQLPATEAEPLAAHLKRFVLRSRVAFELPRADWAAIRLAVPQTPSAASGGPGTLAALGAVLVWETPDAVLAHGPASELASSLAARFPDGGAAREARASDDVGAALPWLGPATRDLFVPQMVDLERLGGVSFTKGCYPGQEIVARSQHLGRVKRRLHRAALASPGTAVAGEAVLAGSDGQPAGTVLAADATGTRILAVLDEDTAKTQPLRTAGGAALAEVALCRPDA